MSNDKVVSLKEALEYNAHQAEDLYKLLRDESKSSDKNYFNEQYVIDWQDRLNKVSITQLEDA